MPLEDDQEAADGVHGDGGQHRDSGGRGGGRGCPRATAEECQGDDSGCEALQSGNAPLRRLSAPHRLRANQLRRHAGGNTEERAAEQRGEHDDGSRSGVPAPRAELDDHLLRCRCDCEHRDGDRKRRSERGPRPSRPECRPDDGDEWDPDRDQCPAGWIGHGRGRAQSCAGAPGPDSSRWVCHVTSGNGNGPHLSIPRSGDAWAKRPDDRPSHSEAEPGSRFSRRRRPRSEGRA